MLLSEWAMCSSKKEASGILSNLTGIKVLILSDLSISNIFF